MARDHTLGRRWCTLSRRGVDSGGTGLSGVVLRARRLQILFEAAREATIWRGWFGGRLRAESTRTPWVGTKGRPCDGEDEHESASSDCCSGSSSLSSSCCRRSGSGRRCAARRSRRRVSWAAVEGSRPSRIRAISGPGRMSTSRLPLRGVHDLPARRGRRDTAPGPSRRSIAVAAGHETSTMNRCLPVRREIVT